MRVWVFNCMAHLFDGFIVSSLTTHLGANAFKAFGQPYEPLVLGALVLLFMWLLLFWMYRRKLFLRV
jgi:heparan-alpha-glucosaminide N-acetyltransferase